MSVRGKKVTSDCTLEITCIILEVRWTSQIPNSAPNADIMRVIEASKKCGYFWGVFHKDLSALTVMLKS